MSDHTTLTPCTRCGTWTPTETTVHDTEQVAMLGQHRADPYCSTTCLDKDAEDHFNYTQGRTR